MRYQPRNGIGDPEIKAEGRFVWVNGGPFWECIARFCPSGLSINTIAAAETPNVLTTSLLCQAGSGPGGETTADDWQLFVEKLQELHGITIDRDLIGFDKAA